jgi:hypothetical protein
VRVLTAQPDSDARLERLVLRADLVWARLVDVYDKHPVAFVVAVSGLALLVRLAATPFGMPLDIDAFGYTLKAIEIARGDFTPIRTHAIGWSLLLAPIPWLAPDASVMMVSNIVRVVTSVVNALTVVPFAILARETLPPRAQPLALAFYPFAVVLLRFAIRGRVEPVFTLTLLGATAGVLVGRRSRAALVVGGVSAGLACWVHPTGVAVVVLAMVLAAATAGRGRRVAAVVLVFASAAIVAAPPAVQRTQAFGNPMGYGFNNRFFVESGDDLWSNSISPPSFREYLTTLSPARVFDRLVVQGAGALLWDYVTYVVHIAVAPFVAYGAWRALREPGLRPIVLSLGLFLLSWAPVYQVYGKGRHLSPALPFALVLASAGVAALTCRRRHAGAWMLAAAVAFAAGESTAAGVQRQQALHHESGAGLVWARWVAENVRGRLALPKGYELVMLFLPDATIGGVDIHTMYAPQTGLALMRPGDFPSLDDAFSFLRRANVTHLLVDGLHHKGTCFEPLLSALAPPPFLTERYANGPAARWPVRVFEIHWERYAPGTVDLGAGTRSAN